MIMLRLCTFICLLTLLPYQTQSACLPFRRLYQHPHWNLIFHFRLWVQILSLSSPSKEAVARRLTGHQSASGRCWMLACASLEFFPQAFLHVCKCLYLDPWVFLTFPLSILSCIPLWGWASDWWMLNCRPGSTHHMQKNLTSFPKIPLIWHY